MIDEPLATSPAPGPAPEEPAPPAGPVSQDAAGTVTEGAAGTVSPDAAGTAGVQTSAEAPVAPGEAGPEGDATAAGDTSAAADTTGTAAAAAADASATADPTGTAAAADAQPGVAAAATNAAATDAQPGAEEPGGAAPEPPAPRRRGAGRAIANALAGFLVVVLVFAAGFGTGRLTAPAGAPDASGEAVIPGESASPGADESEAPASPEIPLLSEDGPLLGSPDAKVVIDYWADYQCPWCAKFGLDMLPLLESRIEDGTLAIRHRDFTFIGTESLWAAVAVRCAGDEGRYWPMHTAVYAAQSGENQGAFSRANLLRIAGDVLGDTTAFEACLADHQKLVDVLSDTSAGHRAGITSTPTLDVNGTRMVSVQDPNELIAAIDAAAAGAPPAVLPSAVPSAEPWSEIMTNGRDAGVVTAPVTVELWMDYQAKESATVVNDLEPELRARVADGRVRLVLRDFAALGEESVNASRFVRCTAGLGGHAWFISDILSVSASGAGAGIFVTDNFLNVAARLGMDIGRLDTCLADEAVAQKVRDETAQGREAGITVGPTIVVLARGKEVARFDGSVDAKNLLKVIDDI